MNMNDKVNRITLRLNDEQFNYVKGTADIVGVSPSEFLRMLINVSLSASKAQAKKVEEGAGRENDKADQHDKL